MAATTLYVTISGKDPANKQQQVLIEGQTVRMGRTARDGWAVPWDPMISREHATFSFIDGKLHVQCLEQARNPLMYCGQPEREIRIGPNEWFQIGHTTFHASFLAERGKTRVPRSTLVEFLDEDEGAGREKAFSIAELNNVSFGNADKQLEILERLPEKIAESYSDEELGGMLSQLLLDAIPHAIAVAVAHFDESELPADVADIESFPPALLMRVQTRDDFRGRFKPSRRLFFKCLQTQSSVLHIFGNDGGGSFTISEGLGWAFCVPIKGESRRSWCLYVSGKGSPRGGLLLQESDLAGDLRFARLVAQFLGSIRQVRMLQEQKTQLSTFFSPKIIEGLTTKKAKEILSPAEREITVLFCDVRGFSKKAETLQSDLLSLLKSVSAALGVMAGGIVERDGAVADFQGDAALGFWGWPAEFAEGAAPACRSALAVYRAFQQGVAETDSLLFGFSIGMGIAHGRAVAGQIGTSRQSKVGVFGPVVNQGSRLEGLTKQFDVPICIDEKTADFVKRFLPPTEGRTRRLARVRPKGMDTAITVFGLLPPLEECPAITPEIIADHDAAVEAIIQGEWSKGLDLLKGIPDDDGPKQFLLRHMAELNNRPPENWDGAFALASK